jgi:6-phosphofructokinase
LIATEAVDRIHTTADSHNRVIVIEVMGRDAGWIAYASVSPAARTSLVPEKEIDIDHVCALLKYNYDHGKHYGIVVVAEGCHLPEVGQVINSNAQLDSFGHARLSGIGEALAELIEKKTGFETRSVNLGHTQRGGVPTAFDRILGQRYGLHAIDMVHQQEVGPHRRPSRHRHHRHHHQGSHRHQPPPRSALLRRNRRPRSQGVAIVNRGSWFVIRES